MMPIGPMEIGVIVLVIVLLFGAAKVPQLARSFGQAMGEFKKAKKEAELNYKKFEDSITGDDKVTEKVKAKVASVAMGEDARKDIDINIKEVAAYMGIDTEGKTEEELKEEVQAKLKSK
jgi:sec-independent protein translocase protein TatA